MRNHEKTSLQYRPEIDGLRAVAVTAVVLHHAGIAFAAGYAGVDIFFVISGYLISSLLIAEWRATGQIDFFHFYARRARRLLPALVVVVLITLVASMWLIPLREQQDSIAQSAAASLVFAGNIYFQFNAGGYFDMSSDRLPLLHLWSLGVEEQFYLCWPLAVLLLLRLRPLRLVSAVAVLALLSFAFAEWLARNHPDAAFFQMPARFWELAAGGLIAALPAQRWRDGRVFAYAGVTVIIAALIVPIEHFPAAGALPAVLGSMALILAVHGSRQLGMVGVLLTSRVMVYVGLISYSLYLWHWPLLAFERATSPVPASMELRAALVVAAFILASLSLRYVERPFRHRRTGFGDAKFAGAAFAGSALLALGILAVPSLFGHAPSQDDLAARTARDMPENRARCNYRGDEALDKFPKPGCNSDSLRPVRVAIWGDSHALAWQPLAWALGQQARVAATSYTRDACAPLLEFDNGKREQEQARCREFNRKVLPKIDGLDTLVITAFWPRSVSERDFKAKFEVTMAQVAPRVGRIILLGATPVMRSDAPRCIASGNLDACAVARQEFDAYAQESKSMLLAVAAAHPNIRYVDMADFFCDSVSCPVLKEGYALFWDNNHVASTAARNFAAQFLAAESATAKK
ncbi:MAG: acyltransferase family protein [Betaproteobacteria bacterium]